MRKNYRDSCGPEYLTFKLAHEFPHFRSRLVVAQPPHLHGLAVPDLHGIKRLGFIVARAQNRMICARELSVPFGFSATDFFFSGFFLAALNLDVLWADGV